MIAGIVHVLVLVLVLLRAGSYNGQVHFFPPDFFSVIIVSFEPEILNPESEILTLAIPSAAALRLD